MSFSKNLASFNIFNSPTGNGWNIVTPSISDYIKGTAGGKQIIPFKLITGNLAKPLIHVFDARGTALFCGKRNLDLNAKNKDELFDHDKHRLSNAYIGEFKKAGIRVIDLQTNTEMQSHTRLPALQNTKSFTGK